MEITEDTLGRLTRKWAMVGYKGGKCISCRMRVTAGNIKEFEFDHHIQVNSQNNKEGRWGGDIRYWPPFTDRWFAWAASVDLICSKCHHERHRQNGQQYRLFSEFLAVQQRLDEAPLGPILTKQTGFNF